MEGNIPQPTHVPGLPLSVQSLATFSALSSKSDFLSSGAPRAMLKGANSVTGASRAPTESPVKLTWSGLIRIWRCTASRCLTEEWWCSSKVENFSQVASKGLVSFGIGKVFVILYIVPVFCTLGDGCTRLGRLTDRPYECLWIFYFEPLQQVSELLVLFGRKDRTQ